MEGEGLSTRVQKVIWKNLRICKKDIKKIITICHENDIQTKLNFIIELPEQTIGDLANIVDLILKCKPSEMALNSLTPYPGTYVGNNFKDLGMYYDIPHWWEKGPKYFSLSNQHLDNKDINIYFKLINQLAVSSGINVMKGY